MEQLTNWRYSEASTQAHPLSKSYPKHLQKISNLLLQEGAKSSPFKNEVALNLDAVEVDKASKEKRAKRNTVDCMFCIKKIKEVTNKGIKKTTDTKKVQPQTVLTELKLNLKSKNNVNIEQADLDKKVNYSIALLGREVQIYNRCLLVIKENAIIENRLRRKLTNDPKYKVLSINELYKTYF